MMADNVTEKKLTPAQRKAIEALLTTGNVADAAKEAGVARHTLYRWMKQPLFASELREAEAQAVQALSRTLASLGEQAGQALRDALGEGEKITVRLRASEIVTDRLLKLRELVDIEQRLLELEKRING
jgi:transposase-like protein